MSAFFFEILPSVFGGGGDAVGAAAIDTAAGVGLLKLAHAFSRTWQEVTQIWQSKSGGFQ